MFRQDGSVRRVRLQVLKAASVKTVLWGVAPCMWSGRCTSTKQLAPLKRR